MGQTRFGHVTFPRSRASEVPESRFVTVHSIRNVLHYDTIWKVLELYGNYQRNWRKVAEHRPELDGMEWKLLEATRIVQVMS
jgi:hypothetical protein